MHSLIDADVLRYRIGFAAQQSIWHVLVKDEEDKGPIATFLDKKEAKEYCEKEPEDFILFEAIEPDPISHCLHSVRLQLESILKETKAKSFTLYLTGKGNFRETIATIKPYKGNRPDRKPFHYNNITNYLIEEWNAVVIDGMEADDAMSITQRQAKPNSTIICTIDKDLDMVPGWHYNFMTKRKYFVKPEEGLRWFYTQILTGDATDNIQGIPRIGKKKADKILADAITEEELFRATWNAYLDYYKDTPITDVIKIMEENARLVYMLQSEDDMWHWEERAPDDGPE